MKHITTTLARTVLALGALALTTGLTTEVNAHDYRHRDRARVHRGSHHAERARWHRHGHRGVGVNLFVVPQRIRSFELFSYRSYYRGAVFHRGHRHHHEVYAFPVRSRHGVDLRPHAYCDGALFADSQFTYHGRHVGFNIRF